MRRSLVAFVLVAIVLVVYAPIVLGGKTWDDAGYHTDVAPPRIAAADAMLHGELPLWWEGTALGVPLLAEPSHGAAYPLSWIAATPRALDLLAIAHVLWCALGVAIWARRRKTSELGAVIAGALIATSGLVASAAIRGVLPALAHLPWIAICANSLSLTSSRRLRARYTVALAGLLALVALAGQPIVLVQALVLAGLCMRLQRAAWACAALAAAGAISMLQWLPALLTFSGVMHDAPGALSISHALDLLVPRTSHDWLPTLFIGEPLIVLAVLGRPWQKRGPSSQKIAVLAVVLVVLAFITPYGELHIAAASVIAAVHAGAGFDRVCEWLHPKLRIVAVIVALAPTAIALPLLFHTVDRSLVADPPAWVIAAITPTDATPAGFLPLPPGPPRVYRPVMGLDMPAETLEDSIATLAGTSAAKWGIGAARSEDPARPPMHDRVWLAAAAAGGALLDRYGVSLAVLPASMVGGEHGPRALGTRGRLAFVRFPASPPASVVYEWMFVDSVDTALARLFPPGAQSGLSPGVIVMRGEGEQNQDEPRGAQPCTVHRWEGRAIDLQCTAERDAYHVISSTAAPGWMVTIDGRAVMWQIADVMRRAVALPSGEHRVAWRYWPPGFSIALSLAALGIAGLLALWLVYGRDTDDRDRPADPARPDAS